MKKNNVVRAAMRALRIENLENREMLDAASILAAAADSVVASTEIVAGDEAVDLSDLEQTGDAEQNDDVEQATALNVAYDPDANSAALAWNAVEDAESYAVQVSKDGGKTFSEVANVEETSCDVANVVVGKSYIFRVVALDAEGAAVADALDATLAPFSAAADKDAFMIGETISASIVGTRNADAVASWYYVTNDGDVEIEGSEGAEYVKPAEQYDVKLVMTGVNDSEGCVVEVTITYVTEHASNVVTTLADTIDPNDGVVSLREALSVYAQDGDTITVDESIAGGVVVLAGKQIEVSASVTVEGAGITIDANNLSRVLYSTADSLAINNLKMVNGLAQTVGGALWADAGSALSIVGCVLADNAAAIHGGAIYATEGLNVQIANTALTGNSCSTYGSAVCAYGANLSMVNVTVAGNASENAMGAIFVTDRADAFVANSIVALNDGADFLLGYNAGSIAADRVVTSFEGWTDPETSVVYPYDPEQPLFLDAENGDYSLAPASQAMDCGDNQYVVWENDAAGHERVQSGVVDLGAYEFSGLQISVDYDAAAFQGEVSWIPVRNAESYELLVSKNGGETWGYYARNLTETSVTVNALYVGSSYQFRVNAILADSTASVVTREATFAPVGLAVSANVYNLGDTIDATILGAENAEGVVYWYNVTEEGDVLITEATGNLSYAPESNLYDVRVVVVGAGESEGSAASTLVSSLAANVDVVYTAETRQASVSWEAIPDAVSYKVRISRDGGETWVDYATTDNLECVVNGLWAGRNFGFRVYGVNEAGVQMKGYREGAFTPFNLTTDAESFLAGDTISLTWKGAADAEAEISWYYVTERGLQEITEAAGLLEYAPELDCYDVKVVATGVNASVNESVSILVPSDAFDLAAEYNADTRKATLTWRAVDGAASYKLQISRDGGETWYKYADNLEDATATVNGVYTGKSYDFRVLAVDADGAILETTRTGVVAPIAVSCNQTFVAGDTVSLTLRAAENAQAEYTWFYVTPDGLVEIPEAANLTEYAPQYDLFDIYVLAVGVGDSLGSADAVVIRSAGEPVAFVYDADARTARMVWRPVDDAAGYMVQISRDGGETWYKYADNLDVSVLTVNGLYQTKSYEFRVLKIAESGSKSLLYAASFAPSDFVIDEVFADADLGDLLGE